MATQSPVVYPFRLGEKLVDVMLSPAELFRVWIFCCPSLWQGPQQWTTNKASASRFSLLSLKACTTTPCLLPLHHVRDQFKRTDDKVTFSMRRTISPKTTCSFAVSPVCKMSRRFGVLQSNYAWRRSTAWTTTMNTKKNDDRDAQEEESGCQGTTQT